MRSPSSGTGSLSIGEFGRLTALSIKALRRYDVTGPLPPAEVNHWDRLAGEDPFCHVARPVEE